MRETVVFTASAHPELAAEICDKLGVELSSSELQRFANNCLGVQLRANCRERDVFIIQPLVPPVQEHLVEQLLTAGGRVADLMVAAGANRVLAMTLHSPAGARLL